MAPLVFLFAAVLFFTSAAPAHATITGPRCAATVGNRLERCLRDVARQNQQCIHETGLACGDADSGVARALVGMETAVRRSCGRPDAIPGAGFGDELTLDSLVQRLSDACVGEIRAVATRALGGPHGWVHGRSSVEQRACLESAFDSSTFLLRKGFRARSRCVRRHQKGLACDVDAVDRKLAQFLSRAADEIDTACDDLSDLLPIDRSTFLAHTERQSHCLIAVAHGGSAPLASDCGPRESIPVPGRAEAARIILDEAVWGTRCGDGSPYAFWIRLAPEGSPVENVVVHMQGGGVCLFNNDCRRVSSGLFRALDNNLATGGYLSNTNPANPFRDWTKVYLPYCTQDVHTGGGSTTVFPDITVHRFGARNVRAALRYVRDVLWTELDRTSEGYRPDRLRVLFGGTSAGGFGATYNYHYLLDDLRWTRATAAPGAALGIDNGEVLGMLGLSLLFNAWDAFPMLPAYCAGGGCSIIPRLQELSSRRLGAVPEQMFLNVSNQVDSTQVATTFFDSQRDWINGHRAAYCANQDLPGVRYFLPAEPRHIHTILGNSSQFPNLSSDGVTVGEWLGAAMADPSAVVDRVEEGDLATRYGANTFACPVAP